MGTRTSILNYKEIFLDGCNLTTSELEFKLDNLNEEGEVIELVEVDKHGNLHFETHIYGIYY